MLIDLMDSSAEGPMEVVRMPRFKVGFYDDGDSTASKLKIYLETLINARVALPSPLELGLVDGAANLCNESLHLHLHRVKRTFLFLAEACAF